jgi:hypothetical protein
MYYIWQERKYLTRYDKYSGPWYATQGGQRFGANGKHIQKCTFSGMFFAQGMFFFCQQRQPNTHQR